MRRWSVCVRPGRNNCDALAWRSSSATREDACTGRISLANSPDGGITLRFLRPPAQPVLRVQRTTPLPLSELDRTVANPIVRSLATIFMLRCDRDTGHAHLFSSTCQLTASQPAQLSSTQLT